MVIQADARHSELGMGVEKAEDDRVTRTRVQLAEDLLGILDNTFTRGSEYGKRRDLCEGAPRGRSPVSVATQKTLPTPGGSTQTGRRATSTPDAAAIFLTRAVEARAVYEKSIKSMLQKA